MSKKMPNITTIASALTNATKLTILDSLMDVWLCHIII